MSHALQPKFVRNTKGKPCTQKESSAAGCCSGATLTGRKNASPRNHAAPGRLETHARHCRSELARRHISMRDRRQFGRGCDYRRRGAIFCLRTRLLGWRFDFSDRKADSSDREECALRLRFANRHTYPYETGVRILLAALALGPCVGYSVVPVPPPLAARAGRSEAAITANAIGAT